MADRPLDTYLNDHLAGATFGSEVARQLEEWMQDTDRAAEFTDLARQVEDDRETLARLMERLDTPRNPVKTVTTWVAHQLSQIKLSGLTAGEREHGLFMALETMSLGIEGKASLWRALLEVTDHYPALERDELETLLARAQAQRETVEAERHAAARRAFPGSASRS